ncbi:hypothetical protein LTR78_004833 [Recurvomyces mirabilis]|uniref:Alpha,alpha-trehalase n=1 Tax=Recurvomyces mirabilis TaxID=574656 RepID=A0AAE0WP88_9PEZI|nr:hypothetical protein LTR78_004833 [Recurvomyces mirabilis]KAK5158003.1 hypothetical protein LTS14_003926 [Recurvomyces mirabilis]
MRSTSTVVALIALGTGVTNATVSRPYPPADSYLQTTNFLNHSSYVQDLDDPQWYLDNIPFIDVPDQSMSDVYYYRTSVIKRHLKWVAEGQGWVSTEFIHPVSWSSKFQSTPDSAPHHVVELRWLRDLNYVKNHIQQYTRGGVEKLSGVTFTHYMHQAIYEHAQSTGDIDFLTSQLDGMIAMYELWDKLRDNTTGLYHRTPLQDAQEYSLPGFLVGGPSGGAMHEWDDFGLSASQGGGNNYGLIWSGPETYRPSMNAYMVAGARVIGQIAAMVGNNSLSHTWSQYAGDLQTKMENMLYSQELNFWIDVVEHTNLRCEGRELIGTYPYRFGIGMNETYIRGLEASLTQEGFLSEFGPTTLEQTNSYFTALKNTTYCCVWNGQSWPFSTSVYLDTLARIARNGLSSIITPAFFNQEMTKYTLTNYKDGVPYTAESHYPSVDGWSGDTGNHSEHYLHSTYLNNIFTDFFGIVPDFGDTLVLQPLVPSNWSHFAIENLPYHGSLLSFVWDQDGSHYKTGTYGNSSAGFSIFSNGTLFHHQPTLCAVNVTLPFNTTQAAATLASQPEWQNIVANPNSPYNLPRITATDCLNLNGDFCAFPAWKMNDGLLWYDTTPDNRWTNNQSQYPYGTINITLPRPRKMNAISLAIFDDTDRGGVAACPAGVKVVNGKGEVVAYKNPWTDCVGNALNTISFAAPMANGTNTTTPDTGYTVETGFLQVVLSDKLRYTTAVTEIQIWVPPNTGPRYEAEDGVIGTFIGSYEGKATGLNGTIENGGVTLHAGAWVELSDVRRADGGAGKAQLTIIGGGNGTVEVQMNWLTNTTVSFQGPANKTIEVEMWRGGNWVDLLQTSGTPFVDAVVVSDG